VARAVRVVNSDGSELGFSIHCLGCDHRHVLFTRPWKKDLTKASLDGPVWSFNGNVDRPTFSPSLVVHEAKWDDGTIAHHRCHSFIRDGQIQYLSDCGHSMAGRTLDLPEINPTV
jgi:hypothetical protein